MLGICSPAKGVEEADDSYLAIGHSHHTFCCQFSFSIVECKYKKLSSKKATYKILLMCVELEFQVFSPHFHLLDPLSLSGVLKLGELRSFMLVSFRFTFSGS